MFGVKQYKYRLNVERKTPQLLFKEINISLKINILNLNENKIQNCKFLNYLENAIPYTLKSSIQTDKKSGIQKKEKAL